MATDNKPLPPEPPSDVAWGNRGPFTAGLLNQHADSDPGEPADVEEFVEWLYRMRREASEADERRMERISEILR